MKVFYIECSGGLWRRIAAEALTQNGWTPILWTASRTDVLSVRETFYGVYCHEGTLAAKGVPIPGVDVDPTIALDGELLSDFKEAESIALQMMERMDPTGDAFTHEERRHHFYDLLGYWVNVVKKLQPDVIVFSIAPHTIYDYILYEVARRFGIPTPMFDRLGLPGWVFAVPGIFEMPAEFVNRSGLQSSLGKEFSAFYSATAAGGKKAVPANFARKIERLGLDSPRRFALIKSVWFELKRAGHIFRSTGFGPINNSYAKLAGVTPPASSVNWWQMITLRVAAVTKKRLACIELDRASTKNATTFSRPYVLLALHFQPERATVPMGGVFGDQTLIADLLATELRSLGWNLLIKEHPWQLSPYSRTEARRSPSFYRRLKRHANVHLLPLTSDTTDLVDGAKAVATVTGSVGWQAICRGIPALVFGAAWYRDCEGAYPIRSCTDLREALEGIQSQSIDQVKVLDFLSAIQSVCIRGVLEAEVEAVADIDDDAVAKSMARALCSAARPTENQ